MHGYKNLDKAIELLENDDRKDFNEFVNSKLILIHTICLFANQKNIKKLLFNTFSMARTL